MSSVFGSLNLNNPQQQQQQQKPSLFGSLSSTAQPQQTSSIFGTSTQQQQQPSLFQSSTQQPSGGLFGSQQKPAGTTGLFGGITTQQQQQQPSLFGSSGQQQPSAPGLYSPFGSQQPYNPLPQLGQSGLGGSQLRAIPGLQPRKIYGPPRLIASLLTRGDKLTGEKPIPEQIDVLFRKWNPQDPECAFQHYFYNQVPAETAPYYHPAPGEDEKKWEEALQKKPNENAIPVLIRGFWELGERIKTQDQAVKILRQRMHDINKSLDQRMQDHDLKFTAKTQKARRKHVELSRRTLALATKVQVLRNRGYALDSTEEELRKKLQQLEKGAFDPVLNGRQEEIWARLTVVRERAEMLQNEVKKMGEETGKVEEVIDEENMKAIKKVRSPLSSVEMSRANFSTVVKRL